MKVTGKAPLASAITIALVAGASHASTIPSMELPQLYADAGIVVHANVIQQHSQWEDIGGNNLIFTYSTLRVNSSAKRAAPSRLMVVRTVGGVVDGIGQTLIGEASVTVGEEVVLFMEPVEGWNEQGVVGFYNGKFSVERDLQGNVTGLTRDLGQRPHATPLPGASIPTHAFVGDLQAIEAGEIEADEHVHSPTCEHNIVHILTPRNQLQGRQLIDGSRPAAPIAQPTLALPFAAPTCPDTNADGTIDVMDLSEMVSAWGESSPTADLDASGTVDVLDLTSLFNGWGPCR